MVPRPQPLGRSQTAAGQPGSTARQPCRAPPGPGAGWSGQGLGGGGLILATEQEPRLEPHSGLPCRGPRGVLKVGDRLHRGGGRHGADAIRQGGYRPQLRLGVRGETPSPLGLSPAGRSHSATELVQTGAHLGDRWGGREEDLGPALPSSEPQPLRLTAGWGQDSGLNQGFCSWTATAEGWAAHAGGISVVPKFILWGLLLALQSCSAPAHPTLDEAFCVPPPEMNGHLLPREQLLWLLESDRLQPKP